MERILYPLQDDMKEFLDKGIYIIPKMNGLFLCENVAKYIGRIVFYEKVSKNIYERTNIQYFLNQYKEDDIKELFLNPENYDLVGYTDVNYTLTSDRKNLIKEKL